jgi:hypothetical protein
LSQQSNNIKLSLSGPLIVKVKKLDLTEFSVCGSCCIFATTARRESSPLEKTFLKWRETTDLSRPNKSAIWLSDNQTVPPTKVQQLRFSLSSVLDSLR